MGSFWHLQLASRMRAEVLMGPEGDVGRCMLGARQWLRM
jgi:hypothetical protein